MGNRNTLHSAQKNKNDEFYTLFGDIASELPKYKEQFKGMRILCPCDWDESIDGELVYSNEKYVYPNNFIEQGGTIKEIDLSKPQKIMKDINIIKCNFVKFLVAHADAYEIRSIFVSGYDPATGEGVKFQDIDYSNYDLVITNPPFSIFREFIECMMNNDIKFLCIGPLTAMASKDIFVYAKNNRLWYGYAKQLSGFALQDGTELLAKNPEGSIARACKWYTNLDVTYRRDRLILTKKYDCNKYPHYYNYDAIEVSKTELIPYDYEGHMCVPITFLTKYNPDQFEIIDKSSQAPKTVRFEGDKNALWLEMDGRPWKAPYERIIIKNKEVYHDED